MAVVAPRPGVSGTRFERVVLGELLGQGAHSAVYRGTVDELSVAVKLGSTPARSSDDRLIVRFRREAAALGRLAGRGVPRAYECGVSHDGRPYVLLEHVEGQTLRARLARGSLSERDALELVEHMCVTLARVHALELVHRDVKPHNIILREGGEPVLIDFGLVVERGMRRSESEGAQVAGTFAYSAPEQAGMLTRPLDGRADLYSLGVVLFECLTGRLPFEADDPGELLHLHATKPAPRLDALGISKPVSELVARLLAKDPDDRYADATAVLRVARELRGSTSPGIVPEPRTGEQARTRQRELATLELALEQARIGRVRVAAIAGAPGMGKTWLLDQLEPRAESRGMEILRVSCRAQGDAPFAVLRRMLDAYAGRALAGEEAASFRERVRAAAGDFAPYLAQVVPSLRSCLSLSEAQLQLAGSHELFCEALVELLRGLGPKPWLVAIDDAHWIDAASLLVLERLVERNGRAVCVVCTLDAGAADALARMRESLASTVLELPPLQDDDVRAVLHAQLGPDPIDASLAAQLRSSSAGTPLAVLSFLQIMIDSGVVAPCWGRWSFDATRLGALALPADARQLALSRLARLSGDARRVMRAASLLDEPFELGALTHVLDDVGEGVVVDALSEAIEQHLVWMHDDGAYRFSHAWLRESLANELPAEARSALHRRVARWLEARPTPDEERDAMLYGIAHHHHLGASRETAREAYDANLRAAQRASALFAYEQAITFFEQARSIAEANGFTPCWRLCRGLAEAYVECGDVPRGLELLALAAERCDDPIERAEIHVFAGRSGFFHETSALSLGGHLERAFAALGEQMPRQGFWLALHTLGLFLIFLFHELTGARFGSRAGQREAWVRTGLWEITGVYSMFNDAPLLMMHAMVAGYVIGWQLGPSRPFVVGSGAFGAAASALPFARRHAPRFFQRGYEVADRLHDRSLRASVQHFEAVAHGFAERPVECERALLECLRGQSAWLDAQALITVAVTLGMHRMHRGHVDGALEILHRYVIDTQKRSRAEGIEQVAISVVIQSEALRGKSEHTEALLSRLFHRLDDPLGDPMRWLQSYASYVWALVERNEPVASLRKALDEAERTTLRPEFASWVHVHDFARLAEGRHVVLLRELEERGAGPVSDADRHAFERILERARSGSRSHPMLTCFCDALLAGKLRLDGDHAEALRVLSRAEGVAHLIDSPNVVYMVRVERARVLSALGQHGACERELEAAHQLASSMGWRPRAERAEAMLRRQRALRQDSGTRATVFTAARTTLAGSAETSLLARDRAALLEVSLALAGELEPRAQAVVALDILLRVLGGERAFIFELRDEGLLLIAARDVEGRDLDEGTKIGRSLLERVCVRREPLVMSGTEEGAALGSESVVAENLRSIICAPLVLRDQLVGVVYVDSRLAKGMFTARHLDILVAIANHIAVAQHMARLALHEAERRELAKDMQLAAAVQSLILPSDTELEHGAFTLATEYAPAAHVGGDFFHVESREAGGVRAMIADVTGHGAGSAMVAACVAGLHRAYNASGTRSARELVAALQRDFAAICHGTYAMTLSVVDIDAEGRVSWLNAGAPPLLVHRVNGAAEVRQVSGTPLGGGELELGEDSFVLEPGDSVLVFSDGLYEMRMADGRELGVSRLRRLLTRMASGADARAVRDYVRREVEEARGAAALEDDRTLIVCTRSLEAPPCPSLGTRSVNASTIA